MSAGEERPTGGETADAIAREQHRFVCTRTPLLYFTPGYPNPRRTMSAVLVVGLVQYTQILLHRFPDWRADMKTAGRVWRLCVHFTLLACLGLTGAWLVGWVGMQLGLVLVDLGQVDVQELGLIVIVAWTVWVAVLAVVLCGNATSLSPKDHGLRLFFQNLKTSFIVTVSFFFLRGCLSPTMGFIDAQQELTILTIFIPILYVALYTTVNAALQLSMGLVVFGGPAALVMSVQLCRLSDFGGPGTFVVVFLHIFIKLIGLFGDDALTKIETDAYDEDDVAPRDPLRPARPIPGRALSPLATEIVPTEGVTPAVDTSAKGTAGATAVEREAQGGRGIGERGGPSGSERQESPSSGDRAAKPIGGIVTGAAGRRPERERGQGNAERIGVEGEMRKPAGSIPGESNGGRRAGGGSAHADAGGPAGHRGRDVKCERGYGRRSREDLAGHVEPGKPGPGINGRGVDIHLGHTVDLDRKIPCMSLVSDSPRSASASPSVGLLRRRLHSPSRSRDVQPKQHTRSPSRPGVPRSVGRASLGAEGITLGDGGTSGERDIGRLTPGTSQNREVAARVGGRGLGRAGWWDTTDGSSKQGSQYGVLRGRMHSRPLPPSGRGQPHRERGVSWGDGDEMIGLGPAGRGKPVDAEGSSHAGALHELDRSLHETERAVSTLPSSPPCERCIRRSYSMDDVLVFGTRGRVEWEDWGGARTTRFDFGAGRRGKSFEDRSSKKVESPGSPAEEGRWGNPPSGSGAPHGSRRLGFNEWVLSVLGGNRSVLAAIETNARFVFKGTVRGVCTLLVVLSLFLGGFQILSLMQEEKQWYPSLIKLSTTPEEQVVVDNAFVVKATLETRGDAVVVEPRYASCGSTWNGLSLIDYALLAELAYFDQHDPEVPLSEVATHFFPPNVTGLDFEIKVPDGENSYAQFFEAYSAKLNISVVAIRGTDVGRISDLIEDLKIWVEPIVLKCLSVVFPTIRIWPDSTSSTVIEWLHETLQLFGLQQQVRSANAFQVSRKLSPLSLAHYYRPLVEYVRAIKGRNIVLTGHSLGGGLARIVGALEKAPSICFSPPGIAQSYRKFSVGAGSLDRAFLHQMSVSVIPEHDFVPMIDTQVGLIQLISCSTAGKALQLSCHMLEGTICDLIKHCGDDRGRFTDCKFEYNMSHLLPHLLGYLEGRMIWVACSGAMLLIFAVLVVLPEFLA